MNLMMLLEMAADGLGERTAIGSHADGTSYRGLFEQANAAANRFRTAGVDAAVLCDESSPAIPIALFGAAWAGVPYVPLNYRLPADDLMGLDIGPETSDGGPTKGWLSFSVEPTIKFNEEDLGSNRTKLKLR